ncbi:TetR family transcriptional regulator [Agaricicola taiwanensis]|uniref:TetR family transcriptional regulator n=1 Tax=Agaricicola taiwanensis TaxID=591372 RepID=A0A8J2YKH3_9RHOB|nr:TetR family transcriptional regulator [Agaricicola taiwanensis]GGE48527.1 TetR family transcriptional regulator [Agaricicola taiwanensis]
MGRNRTIDRDAVLDAAQKVVSRDGAIGLTLDAVAHEAGISKASVLYDCKTKQQLIQAVIERRIARDTERARDAVSKLGDCPNPSIEALIASFQSEVSDEDRAVAIHLIAAMAQDNELRAPVQELIASHVRDIRATSATPRGALLAFFALEGMKLLDWFGLHRCSEAERDQLIKDIRWLVDQSPGDPPPSPEATHG